MNVYQAVLAAADHIERNPGLFSYFECESPGDHISKGCYVGWIGFFMGERGGQRCGTGDDDAPMCRRLLGVSFAEFQGRMIPLCIGQGGTLSDAQSGARALRLYAAKYLAPPAPVQTFDFQKWAAELPPFVPPVTSRGQTLGVSAQ